MPTRLILLIQIRQWYQSLCLAGLFDITSLATIHYKLGAAASRDRADPTELNRSVSDTVSSS